MAKYKWDAGTRYGMLVCSGKSYSDERSRRHVEVVCDCDKIKWVRLDSLSVSKSCGCLEVYNKGNTQHGLNSHGLHKVWISIKQRCYCDYSNRYKNYGAVGVVMCDEWLNEFMSFYKWGIANGWEKGLQIDKDILYKKKNGGEKGLIYSPEYCCFVTPKENSRNRTTSVYLEYNGEKKTLAEWSELKGLSQQTLQKRIKRGWSIDRMLTEPVKILKKRLSN